ncbi:M48 family metallopeptidase [Methylomonas methanica]|uniref:Peptidase M48 Ste24p n=1 Tax=Methylomonas methanica (strain DSM 25384 / MC09) TaxID=857087 RepID=G0A687_METMM|nr:M48 family metallopeptidase [Methylomonas methanica]AEG01715.1 peptidase M48 Ste24p [Methylomonas methanica MC09]
MTQTNRLSSSAAKSGLSALRRFWRVCALFALLIGAADAEGLCPGEMQRAAKLRQRIVRDWPLRPANDEVSQYVQSLGVYLAQRYSAAGSAIPWRFTLVRNLAPNAFSIGAGNIFVNEGAVNFARDEAELAAILAHELAHELAGHFCQDNRSGASRGLFDIFSTQETQQYDVDIGSVMQKIDPVKEQQADRIALGILQAAGFDPRAMLDVAKRLPPGDSPHMMDVYRIRSLEHIIGNTPRMPSGSSEAFQNAKRLLNAE